MKIITLVFLLAGFSVNAQEKIRNVYVERVELSKEISPKKAQAHISPNITENDSENINNETEKISETKTNGNPNTRVLLNSELVDLNAINDTINKTKEKKSDNVVTKTDAQN